ncbi:MAG: hypothetical protein GXP06_13875 [Alphaproteobacteria bacterium]|nr:hypothetical protein [Alphaproteobacteria bacterium]
MKNIEIAEEYRRQRVEAESRKQGFDTVGRDGYLAWAKKNRPKLLEIARNNGFEVDRLDSAVDDYMQLLAEAPARSEFDDIGSYIILKSIIDRIENICGEVTAPTHDGVVFGAFPCYGVNAFQAQVMTTEASIIAVSNQFIPFCNQVSKAMAKTLRHIPRGNFTQVVNDPKEVDVRLKEEPYLAACWALLFSHYAVDGWTPRNLGWGAFSIIETSTRVRILEAIETFAIAHEYGHHVAKHGQINSSAATSDLFEIEYEADLFARGITMRFGTEATPPNPYASSGACAVMLFGFIELIDRTKAILSKGGADLIQKPCSHPLMDARIQNIEKLDANIPPQVQAQFSVMRSCFREIIEIVWRHIEPAIIEVAGKVDLSQYAEVE